MEQRYAARFVVSARAGAGGQVVVEVVVDAEDVLGGEAHAAV